MGEGLNFESCAYLILVIDTNIKIKKLIKIFNFIFSFIPLLLVRFRLYMHI